MLRELKRYEFSERLADILGESRRDLRFRVTLMVSGGLMKPGPRGRGAPAATPDYAANLLLGVMAAPQQAHTVEAIRCYRALESSAAATDANTPRVVFGPPSARAALRDPPALPLLAGRLQFGQVLVRLLELARAPETRQGLAGELFGIWLSRAFPVAAVQLGAWSSGRRTIITRHYELPEGARPPAWLDGERGGAADPGLFHTVFLPVSKLIEIGSLTTLPEKKGTLMLNLGPKMASVANLEGLARLNRHRSKWEKLLEFFAATQAWTDKLNTQESRLVEVTGFGSNPGNLRMFSYVPPNLPASAPLVVLLHGCTQNAMSYDRGTGWSTLADRYGFALLLPQQHWTNNPLRAFNWFRPEDTARDSGEPASISQMIARMTGDHGLDRGRVYVTGVSSGGAMASVMLASYPDVFAGGAIIAGAPYGSANNLQEAFETMFQGRALSPGEWGGRVRSASPHQGPWPRVSVWHGDADAAVKPANADAIASQWADVHGLDAAPSLETTVEGYPHRVWQNAEGENLIESYTITGMSHGLPLSPGDEAHQCGTAAPYFLDVGISSTFRIADFFGIVEGEPNMEPVRASVEPTQSGDSPRYPTAVAEEGVEDLREGELLPPESPSADAKTGQREDDAGSSKQSRDDSAGSRPRSDTGLGLDVHGIISQSLEAAGLLKGSAASRKKSNAPLGIDIPGIISTSLEAAGVLKEATRNASEPPPTPPTGCNGDTQWKGEGWELVDEESGAIQGGPMLYGQAASGNGCDVGRKAKAISRQITLGSSPRLSYLRRLDLHAGVNDYTKASFSVLVDGLPVDEVSAIGMDHTEQEWLQRSDIDLKTFADRTVTLTLEVAANSNVCNEVSARAWVDRITLGDGAHA